MTDASDSTVGTLLQQFINSQWYPIAFSQRNFSLPKQDTASLTLSCWHNLVVDALSRVETNSLQTSHPPAIDFNDIAVAQQNDSKFSQLPTSAPSLKLQFIPLPTTGTTILCDMSTGVPCQVGSIMLYFTVYTHCLILVLEQPNNCRQLTMCGQVLTEMSTNGHRLVYSV